MTTKFFILRTPLLSLLVMTLVITGFFNAAAADKIETYSFPTKQFTSLRIQDNVNVFYNTSPDSIAKITYNAPKDFEDAFIFTNNDGTLTIQVTTEDVGKTDLPTIHVYSNRLEKVANYSDFNVTVEHTGDVKNFEASLIGNGMINLNLIKADHVEAKSTAGRGTIIMQGECQDAIFRITGTGTINAENLFAKRLVCKIFGGGAIYCPNLESLVVKGLGSTRVLYPGNPVIKHRGGGKLIPLD